MKFAGKQLDFYTPIITMPFVVLVCWSLVGLVAACVSAGLAMSAPFKYGGFLVPILVYGYVGWSAAKNYHATSGQSAWAGVLCGVAAGLAGAIIGIITIFMVPEITEQAINQAMAKGAPISREFMEKMMLFGSFAGLILGPIMGGVMGAVFALIGSAIAPKPELATPGVNAGPPGQSHGKE